MVRTIISIDGSRISNNNFNDLEIIQKNGDHHSFKLSLMQDHANKSVLVDKTESWIGKKITIAVGEVMEMELDSTTIEDVFLGIVTSVKLRRRGGQTSLDVSGYSPTISLDNGPASRSFTEMGLQEIVTKVSEDYEEAINIEPIIYGDVLPYTVQYNESNFEFINRLANQFGEWCYYDGLEFHFGQADFGEEIVLDFGHNGLTDFGISLNAIPSKFEMSGYNYESNEVIEKPSDPHQFPTSELATKVWDISENVIYKNAPKVALHTTTNESEFEQIVNRRVQVAMDEIEILTASSTNYRLKVGSKIEIQDQIIGENYGVYIISDIKHEITQGGNYKNTFEAVPGDLISPPVTNMIKSPNCETQFAKVTDVEDEDALGRVKVELVWQSGTGETTPWIRVASPYSGKDKGFYIIPEVGDHVLVSFEANNPEKPYVLSAMYNGEDKPEWYHNKNYFKGFKSKGGNEWKFDDKQKSISINAPSEVTVNAGSKINLKIGSDGPSMILDKEGSKITIKASHIRIENDDGHFIELKNDFTLNADNIAETATGNHNIECNISGICGTTSVDIEGGQGKVNASGGMVKINS